MVADYRAEADACHVTHHDVAMGVMHAENRPHPTHVTLRIMTSRWGSCTPKTGRIRLNLQLGLMDPRFLEYVLVHEMTHLWENGHGEDFQRRMSAYLPQWRQLRRELNRHVVL